MLSLLDILILLPIGAAAAIFLGAPARFTALLASGLTLIVSLIVFAWCRDSEADELGYYITQSIPLGKYPELNWALGVDGMSLVLIILTGLVTFCAMWMTPIEGNDRPRLLYGGSLLIAGGAMGAFLATDLFFFYAFHELALIPTFLLIGMCGYGDCRAAAWRITIYLGVGSIVLLAGLLYLITARAGGDGELTFNMLKLLADGDGGVDTTTQGWVLFLLIIGFGTLISLFPFHSWAAPAYSAAPTPVAMLHAGVLKKFGLYGLLRIALPLLPGATEMTWVTNLLLILLIGNIIVVGLVTIAQRDLNQMLASSSVMHMGYLFLGVASYNALGLSGAVILMFAHGVSIALLFALAGQLRSARGGHPVRLDRNLGLGPVAPWFTFAFGVVAFASIGLPGFANFAGEALVFLSAFKDFGGEFGPLQWAAAIAVWGVVISAVYMLRAVRSIFQGEADEHAPEIVPGNDWVVPAVLLGAALLLIGVCPWLFGDVLQPTLDQLSGAADPVIDAGPAGHAPPADH